MEQVGYPVAMQTQKDRRRFRDSEEMRAWRLFLESYRRVIDVLADELEHERGLSLSRYDVLVQLYGAPEHRLRMNDLANSVLLSKSGLTRLIDRMETEGLVERASCPDDRRGSFAVLTPRGEEVFKDAAPVHLAGIDRHFTSYLSAGDAKTLIEVFGKITGALSGDAGPEPCG